MECTVDYNEPLRLQDQRGTPTMVSTNLKKKMDILSFGEKVLNQQAHINL